MSIARAGVVLAVMIAATSASAATVADSPQPAEFPPASFSGAQYVDSRGCVFIRADMSGTVNWVPRVKRNREQLCGFQPTRVAGATSSAPRTRSARAPEIIIPDVLPNGQPSGGAAATAAPVATASAPAPRAPRPATSVARVPTPAAAAPTRIVAPVVSPSVIEPAAPRRVSLSEACAGRHGVQRGIVSARTGQPLDCGSAPSAPVAVQPLQQRRVGGTACLSHVQSGRITLSGSCAPQSARPYDTLPVQKTTVTARPAAVPSPSVAPRAVVAPVVKSPVTPQRAPAQKSYQPGALACLEAIRQGRFTVTTPDGRTHRCAPQSLTPYDGRRSDASPAPTVVVPDRSGAPATARVVQTSRPRLFGAKRAPGMRSVWNDNRMNPNRGITVLRLPG